MIEMEVKPLFTVTTEQKEFLEFTAHEVFEVDAEADKYSILVGGEKWTGEYTMHSATSYLCRILIDRDLLSMQDPFVELWWEFFYGLGYSDKDIEDKSKSDECDTKFAEKYGFPLEWVKKYWSLYE